MSQAKSLFKPQPVLVLVVGARHIDGAVLIDSARSLWREGSAFRIEIAGSDLDAACAALTRVPPVPGCASMRVAVADNWLASGNIPWSAASNSKAGLDAAARMRLAQDGYALTTRDVIRRDDAPFGTAHLALAYPAALLDALTAAATRAGCTLDSVLSLSAAAWPLAPRQSGAQAILIAGDGMLALASGQDGRPQNLTVRAAADSPMQDQARSLWQRQSLREPQLGGVKTVQWLDLDAAGTRFAPGEPFASLDLPVQGKVSAALRLAAHSQRSALDAVQRAPSLRQALPIALAVVLAGAALVHAWQSAQEHRALASQLEAPSVIIAAPPLKANWTAQEKIRVGAVNTAIRQLNLPFAAILRALEPPRDLRVAVLSVTTAPATSRGQASRVKIVAEARTGAEMARYVAFLGERKPFTGAHLSEHEIDETAAERPYRFTLEASWND